MRAAQVLVRYSVLVLCFAAPFAFSQTGGQTGGGTSGGSTTKTAPPVTSRPTNPQQPQDQRPIFLRGRVMLDDGMPPSESVTIERVCNGRVRRESYTDSRGQFSFQLGAGVPMFQDATVDAGFDPARPGFTGAPSGSTNFGDRMSSGSSARNLMNCELRASLPGFRLDSIPLAGRLMNDEPDVGTIVLHRLGKVEGTSISATTLRAPKDAKKAFERGTHLLKEHKPTEATQAFAKAVALYPKYAEAMVKLGEIYMDEDRGDDAGKLFQQAIEADAKFIPPYFDLALLTARKHDWKQVADLSDRALALNAYEYPAAYYLNAVGNYNLHNFDVAEKSARMARRLDSQYRLPKIDLVLANILLQRRDYAGAAEQLRSFLNHAPSGAEADAAREMLAHTESRLAAPAQAANAVATPK